MQTLIFFIYFIIAIEVCWTMGSALRFIKEGEARRSILPGIMCLAGIVLALLLHYLG